MKEYIEREVALNSFEEIMNIACEQVNPRIGKAMRTGTCFGIAMCRNEVRHIPAGDVVEVRHGRWEECDWVEYDGHGECVHYPHGGCVCTNCRNAFKKELVHNPRVNYCPHCGAKMDKEE